jgi:hypothetical protein
MVADKKLVAILQQSRSCHPCTQCANTTEIAYATDLAGVDSVFASAST